MIVIGDIGGTNGRFALIHPDNKEFVHLEVLPSGNYPNFLLLLGDYLRKQGNPIITRACFSVAGPVIDGVCKVTNLPWIIDAREIAKTFNIPRVTLLNDLEAEAHAIGALPKESFISLSNAKERVDGNRAIISPGTGLGEAGLFWDGKNHRPFASEGGHADFGPTTELQVELASYLIKKFGHASTERILSGPGLQNIFHFFADVKKRDVPSLLKEEMSEQDPSKVITERALQKKSPICEETLDFFLTILGQEAGNCALRFLAIGGIYLGGGIVPKILPVLQNGLFLKAFLNKGRMRDLLEGIPVFALNNKFSALYGAMNSI